MDAALKSSDPTLHVFEQGGEWHRGITIDKPTGIGMKVVAFSEEGFGSEAEAREDGEYVRPAPRTGSRNKAGAAPGAPSATSEPSLRGVTPPAR